MGFGRRWFGRGFGFGGGGRGWRHWFHATGLPGWMRAGWPEAPQMAVPSKEEQAQALKRQAEFLEGSLAEIRRRLAEIEKAPANE
jgi:hypothetical protein